MTVATSEPQGGFSFHVGPVAVAVPSLNLVPFLQNLVNSAPAQFLEEPASSVKSAASRALSAVPQRRHHGATAVRALAGATTRDIKEAVLGITELGGLIAAGGLFVAQGFHPKGPGCSDRSCCEKCCNVATSLPLIACGCHALRHRKTAEGKAWGGALVGVGLASSLFHGSWGRLRPLARKLDYWSIALTSNIMTRALYPGTPGWLTAVGMLATPFKPFLVSFANSSAMEVKYLARARKNEKLRPAQRLHAATCLVGLGAFALEEWKPEWVGVHSAWHCLSAVSVATVNHLASDVERNELRIAH